MYSSPSKWIDNFCFRRGYFFTTKGVKLTKNTENDPGKRERSRKDLSFFLVLAFFYKRFCKNWTYFTQKNYYFVCFEWLYENSGKNVKPAIHWGIYNFMKINERTLLVRKSHFEGDIPPILYEFILELWAKFGRWDLKSIELLGIDFVLFQNAL